MRLKRVLLVGFVLLILAGAYFYGYPEVLSYFPHPLHAGPSSVSVHGIYYQLPLAGVDSVSLESDQLRVIGRFLPPLNVIGSRHIARQIPQRMVVSHLTLDDSSVWHETDMVIRNLDESRDYWKRSFLNMRTGDRFWYGDPFLSWFQVGHVYRGQKDTSVIVFAFGKMGQDAKTWMGCILITNRDKR